MNKAFFAYLFVMALTTYLIRMIPFALLRKKIKSVYIQSFLYYVPYAVLGAMTFPYIFYATGNVVSSLAGTVAALLLSYKGKSLVFVAVVASLVSYLTVVFTGVLA